jgi:hypothetical protein
MWEFAPVPSVESCGHSAPTGHIDSSLPSSLAETEKKKKSRKEQKLLTRIGLLMEGPIRNGQTRESFDKQ